MVRKSGCRGIVSVLLTSLLVGMTGCMNLGGDQRVLAPPPAASPPAQVTRAAYPYTQSGVMPVSYAGQSGVMPPGAILTTPGGMMDPRLRVMGQGQAMAPEEVMMEPPMMGMPGGQMLTTTPQLPLPTELARTAHAPHRVAPPDILYLEALRLVPRGPYRLSPLEVLQIEVTDTLPRQDIKGLYMISPEGNINLGHTYGSLRVGGLTVEQAQAAIKNHLAPIIKNANVNVALVQMRGMQNIKGEHLVRPDGTISLGMYGSVFVAGMNLGQVKKVIEDHLAAYLVDPQVSVDVFAYNSRKIYIIADGAGYGQQVIALPATGGETVLDAISRVQGLPSVASLKKIWVSRPSPVGHPTSTVLPVDWKAITQAGRTETNYQLLPGDRIYIHSDFLICLYNYIDKALSPVERVLGVLFLGVNVFNSVRNGNNNGGVIVATGQ